MFIQENLSLASIQVNKIIFIYPFINILDRGNMTCQLRPGSLHYEVKDANSYAAWEVDYLKLDSCHLDATPAVVEYSIMRDALNASGRPIFFSLCGMCVNYFGVTIDLFMDLFFIPKVVLVNLINGRLAWRIAGEQQQISKIIGLQ
jgi:hypothetical protein